MLPARDTGDRFERGHGRLPWQLQFYAVEQCCPSLATQRVFVRRMVLYVPGETPPRVRSTASNAMVPTQSKALLIFARVFSSTAFFSSSTFSGSVGSTLPRFLPPPPPPLPEPSRSFCFFSVELEACSDRNCNCGAATSRTRGAAVRELRRATRYAEVAAALNDILSRRV